MMTMMVPVYMGKNNNNNKNETIIDDEENDNDDNDGAQTWASGWLILHLKPL